MEHHKNIFSIFYYDATSNEKKMILSVSLLCAFFSSGISGIPVWFKLPQFTCSKDSQTYICDESDFCSSPHENFTSNTKSLVYELSLICERQYIKRWLLTLIFLGGLFGCLLNIAVYIRSERRKTVLALIGFLFSFAQIGIFFFPSNDLIVGICLMIIAFSIMIGNSYGFTIINEYLSGDLAKASTIFLTLSRGMIGILFALFCYLVNSCAQLVFLTIGSLVFFLSLYLYYYENEKGIKEKLTKTPTNVVEFFKAIMPLTEIRNNFLIFIFVWTTYSVTINDILIELDTIGGNLYLNMSLFSSIEVLASFLAGIIIMKFDSAKSLKNFSLMIALIFLSFFFSPSIFSNSSVFEQYLQYGFLFLLLCGKLFSEIVSNLIYVFAPKYLTDEFTAFYLINVRLFSRVCLLFLPHINYLFRMFHLHVFLFLAIIWFLSRFFLIFIKEEAEGLPEILEEYKVDLSGRMSILSGSMGMDYTFDNLLKNIEIGGKKLSTIRMGRPKSFVLSPMKVILKKNKSLGANLLEDA